MITLKFYGTILLSFVLIFNLVSAQDTCEICMQEAPETCPLECTAPEPPPPSYPFCGDGNCNQDETCYSCFVDCGACEEETAEECIESWSCSAWSNCDDGQQTRSCTDSRNCGTFNNKPDEMRTCLEETIAVTENISLGVNQTLTDNLTNISEVIVNESLWESNETEESKILIGQDDENLQETKAEEVEVDKKREGMLNYLNKKAPFFMFLISFTAFIFIMMFILFRKRRKIKKTKTESIANLSINENVLNQLSAYIKRQLNKGFDIGTIRRKLIDVGYNPYTIEKIIEHMKSTFEINKK